MKNKKNTKVVLAISFMIAMVACAKVPVTGRKQLKVVPSSQLQSMSYEQYAQVIKEGPLSQEQAKVNLIKKVGVRIQTAVEKYMEDNGYGKRLNGFKWEYNLIEKDILNAWCMPGGKVAFYTGILPVCKDEDGIAVVMGHEIAHAIARHGNERMSQQLVLQMGVSSFSKAISQNPAQTAQIFQSAVGLGISLPFSRKHEIEADEMGLIFMAMAGYNPKSAPDLWRRMKELSGGEAPPEFMSTHPSNDTRIKKLEEKMEEAMKYYKKR